MKTPERIKRNLEDALKGRCNYCPYKYSFICNSKLIADALDLIQQLESHSPKWTSIAEHLPQKTGKYLVYSKVGTMYTSTFTPDIYKRWPHFGKVGVTHWMPRPEEPKGGE